MNMRANVVCAALMVPHLASAEIDRNAFPEPTRKDNPTCASKSEP